MAKSIRMIKLWKIRPIMSFIVYFLLFIASTVSSQEEPPLPAGLGEEITPDTGEPELPMGLQKFPTSNIIK